MSSLYDSFIGNGAKAVIDAREWQRPLQEINLTSQEKYKMTFPEWESFNIDYKDILINSSTKGGRDVFTYLPIGVHHSWYRRLYIDQKTIGLNKLNTELVEFTGNDFTDNRGRFQHDVNRKKIHQTLQNHEWINRDFKDYKEDLCRFKFSVSPEGNGIDCHRHYESWYTRTIPIIEEREVCYKKFTGLPVLWTQNYSEISVNYLNKEYDRLRNSGVVYDFSSLFFSSYGSDEKALLKEMSLSHLKAHYSEGELSLLYNT